MAMIEIGKTRKLMLDDEVVELMQGTRREIHAWEKDEDNPVLVKQYSWEGIGPYAGNRIAFDPVDGKYRMWYTTYGGEHMTKVYYPGCMESGDGLTWTRRPERIDSRGNIIIDPRGKAGDYRFLCMGHVYFTKDTPGHNEFGRSRDGVHWEPFEEVPWWEGTNDVLDLLWDSRRERFVTYYKIWKIIGTTAQGAPVQVYFADFQKWDEGGGILKITGRELSLTAGKKLAAELHDGEYYLRQTKPAKNDGGGGIVTSDIAMLRVIGRAESEDFIHWTETEVVLEPEEEDRADAQYYGMPVFEYQDLYIALPRYFEGLSGKMEARIGFSRDGVHFTIPDRKSVLSCGPGGSWDAGMVIATPDPLEIGGRLCLYYGGMDLDHTKPDTDLTAATGRAWLRKDGFASLTGGIMLTKPLILNGDMLYINAKGQLNITLRDLDGSVTAQAEWNGNATGAPVQWQSGRMPHGPCRIEFNLRSGQLFSFWCQ